MHMAESPATGISRSSAALAKFGCTLSFLVFIHSPFHAFIALCACFATGMGKSLDFPIYAKFCFPESSLLEVLAPVEDGRGISDQRRC